MASGRKGKGAKSRGPGGYLVPDLDEDEVVPVDLTGAKRGSREDAGEWGPPPEDYVLDEL
ncbi:MAG: hypothetical protein LBT54_04110 [Bifidobacteriaceae bacterium]|nr:hypothetical protein [Bifidobacteriaceae bacterium]